MIERHFSVSLSMYGPDAKYSLDPTDMKNLCEGIRIAEAGLTHFVDKNDISDYKNMKEIFEKSIVTRRAIKRGKILERDDITTKKPGTGIKALIYHDVLGKKVKLGSLFVCVLCGVLFFAVSPGTRSTLAVFFSRKGWLAHNLAFHFSRRPMAGFSYTQPQTRSIV